MKDFISSFWRGGGGGKEFECQCPFFAVCQVTLIQNNQYAQMAYFGLIYSVPIQKTNLKICLEKQSARSTCME